MSAEHLGLYPSVLPEPRRHPLPCRFLLLFPALFPFEHLHIMFLALIHLLRYNLRGVKFTLLV